MSPEIRLRGVSAIVIGVALFVSACGGGGGGGSGSSPDLTDDDVLDPATDVFLVAAAFARPIPDVDGSLAALVNPASLYETDPLTGAALPGFPRVLSAGTDLDDLATISFAQILDPLTPQVPLVPRNAALVLEFSQPLDRSSLNLATKGTGPGPGPGPGGDATLTSSSTLQLRHADGALEPTRVFVDGARVVLLGDVGGRPGFEGSPLLFDPTGEVVEDPKGFLRLVLGPGVGTGTLRSEDGDPLVTRTDGLGSPLNPIPINTGNSARDAIVLQTDTGVVRFNGFLPDLSEPRLVRPVGLDGVIAEVDSVSGQFEIRDDTLALLPNTLANGGAGEWAGARMEITSGGTRSQLLVEQNRTSNGDAVYRLAPGQVPPPAVAAGDTYRIVRSEFFEPLPPPLASDPVALARMTVDPQTVPRDPDDPQDLLNSDLRYFVRMFDEQGVERTDRWNPATGVFLPVPPRTTLQLQFNERMDLTSMAPYESLSVVEASAPLTDPGFDRMRIGQIVEGTDATVVAFRPRLEDQIDPGRSRDIGFGGTPSQLRLVLRTIPSAETLDALRDSLGPTGLGELVDLTETGVRGCFDLGGRGLGMPAALFDQGAGERFLFASGNPLRGAFPPAVDLSMTFETLPTDDDDYGVLVHRFMGQAVTANHVYEAGTVHDSVTAGVEYKDHPARDEDGDGDIDRRFIYGPTVVEVGLNLPGRLTGASAAVIEHLIDDNNPPKPGPVTNPNGEDFLISVGFGTSTPINSAFGARFQHVYRATDASPARNDFEGVVLDLVGLAWSPFEDTVSNTVLNDFSLLIGLGHSENGRGPNTNQVNGIPRKEHSGLLRQFDCNRLEHRQDCCQTTLAAPLAKHVQDNPQPLTTAVVQQGTPYTISSSNLFRPVNAGLNPGGANQYLDYPTFNAGIDPFFGKEDVFSFPYDSVLPMLIEYAIGPNQTPPALNLYRFSPGIQTSVLPRFRIWSQGQHPAAWGVPNWSTNVGGCLENQPPWFRAGEGGPLLRPGSFDLAIEPPEQNNGMPTLFPSDYILPPRRADPVCTEPDPDNGNIYGDSVPVQPAPVAIFGQILTGTPGTATQPPDPPDCGCITRFPEPVVDPASNYYFANGMLVNPLPNFDAWPGPTGIPPTQWAGYGVPPGGVGINGSPCIIPPALGGDNQNPSAVSNEPGMSTPPGIYGDNSRYYMLWKYRKRVSVIESPTLRVDSDRVVFERPIILPPVADVDPAASLAIDIKAGSKLDLAIAALDSGYVRTDEPEFSALVSGDDLDHVYVKFRAAFGVAQGATQPPALESIAIPYRKVR